MRLTEAQSRELLREHGAYVTEACDRCGAVLGPIQWTILGEPGAWCSQKCREGVDHRLPVRPKCSKVRARSAKLGSATAGGGSGVSGCPLKIGE